MLLAHALVTVVSLKTLKHVKLFASSDPLQSYSLPLEISELLVF